MTEEKNTKQNEIQTFGEYDVEMEKLRRKDLKKRDFRKFWGIYKHRVISLALALITAICLLSLGFWRTLLIWIVMLIGYAIGAWKDRDIKFLKFFSKLFEN
ncbi:MAG: DUF2273 domain-containing protein [Tissierellia bacterium]|nr:DUF2273 domain-containing protein [Tissierellia bacterium]